MSTPATPTTRPPSWPMLRAMVGVGLACGVLIVSTYEATRPIIARNRAEALQAAIFEVLPAAESSNTFRLLDSGGFEPANADAASAGALLYAGYDASGDLVGFAIEGAGMGYQDTIRLLWGYDAQAETAIGLRVLESKETPGLGDKISTDAAFQANFDALSLALDASGQALAHPVVAVKQGEKTEAWQLDGITGATISSVAVAEILDRSANFWLPRIRDDLATFEGATP